MYPATPAVRRSRTILLFVRTWYFIVQERYSTGLPNQRTSDNAKLWSASQKIRLVWCEWTLSALFHPILTLQGYDIHDFRDARFVTPASAGSYDILEKIVARPPPSPPSRPLTLPTSSLAFFSSFSFTSGKMLQHDTVTQCHHVRFPRGEDCCTRKDGDRY